MNTRPAVANKASVYAVRRTLAARSDVRLVERPCAECGRLIFAALPFPLCWECRTG